jgi:uncharacterized protein YbjQ (UPF0145 family)
VTAFDDWTPEQIEEGSIRELEAGRLPIRAQQRLATMRADQAFTSDLTVDEHHAIRSVGFSPVGQVMGSYVYHAGYIRTWNCGGYQSNYRAPRLFGSFQDSDVVEVEALRSARYDAYMVAVKRMRLECQGLAGDGVVAVRLTVKPFPGGGLEFQAIGTAVRAVGDVHPRRPFTSDLSGQDFAKLIVAGWVPCGIVLGLAVVIRHDDYRTQAQRQSWTNREIAGYTELVHSARHRARERLKAECARRHGTGVVVRETSLRISEQRCLTGNDQRDHLAEAILLGTAITPFRQTGGDVPPAPLPIMRLR